MPLLSTCKHKLTAVRIIVIANGGENYSVVVNMVKNISVGLKISIKHTGNLRTRLTVRKTFDHEKG
jgi:hypothetical protein